MSKHTAKAEKTINKNGKKLKLINMDLKKLREQLPKKGYSALIQDAIGETNTPGEHKYSKGYIVCVVNATKINGAPAYNQEIIDAAIKVAKEHQAKLEKQAKSIEKLTEYGKANQVLPG